jgi:hypothetical protein
VKGHIWAASDSVNAFFQNNFTIAMEDRGRTNRPRASARKLPRATDSGLRVAGPARASPHRLFTLLPYDTGTIRTFDNGLLFKGFL